MIYAETLPQGTWQTKADIAFLPRGVQNTSQNALYSGEYVLLLDKMTDSRRLAFPVNGQVYSETQPNRFDDWKMIFAIYSLAPQILPNTRTFHNGDSLVGEYVLAGTGIMPTNAIHWRARAPFAPFQMSPDVGRVANLLNPAGDYTINIEAYTDWFGYTNPLATATASPCPRQEFDMQVSTDNFAPILLEEIMINVTLPGCCHANDNYVLRVEATREGIANAREHIAWIDCGDVTTGQNFVFATNIIGNGVSIRWIGQADVSLPAIRSPDVFNSPKKTVHRNLKQVSAGKPIPSPFFDLRAMLFEDEMSTNCIQCITKRIYVPEVINIVKGGGELYLLEERRFIDPDDGETTYTYQGIQATELEAQLSTLSEYVRAFFPSECNIRIVYDETLWDRGKTVTLKPMATNSTMRGITHGLNPMNYRKEVKADVYVNNCLNLLLENYSSQNKQDVL